MQYRLYGNVIYCTVQLSVTQGAGVVQHIVYIIEYCKVCSATVDEGWRTAMMALCRLCKVNIRSKVILAGSLSTHNAIVTEESMKTMASWCFKEQGGE